MRLGLIKCLVFTLTMIGLLRFESWYFTDTIEGIVIQIDNQNRVLLAQNLDLEEDIFERTYMELFAGDYDVIEVNDIANVSPGMHIRIDVDGRSLNDNFLNLHAIEYEVLEVVFSDFETAIPTFSEVDQSLELAKIFPQTEGRFQLFSGYADYGHIQTLTQIREKNGTMEFYFEGQMNDARENAENRQFNLMYQVDGESIVEFIHNRDEFNSLNNEVLFHSIIERKIVLMAPLELGNSWEQQFTLNGRQYTAVTEIIRVEKNENGKMEYETLTRVENIEGYYDELYEERRIFVEGSGMTNFSNRQSFEQLNLTPNDAAETGNIFVFGFSLALERQDTARSHNEEITEIQEDQEEMQSN